MKLMFVNLATDRTRHLVSLPREKEQSGLLAKKEQNLKSVLEVKNFLISSEKKSRKVPPNLKCNYNKATLIMCMSPNVLASAPIDLRPPPSPPWEKVPSSASEIHLPNDWKKESVSVDIVSVSVMLLLYWKCSFKNNTETIQWKNIF